MYINTVGFHYDKYKSMNTKGSVICTSVHKAAFTMTILRFNRDCTLRVICRQLNNACKLSK